LSLREQLHAYIAQLEKRLRWSVVLRGLAILTVSALLATLLLVAIANARAFFARAAVTAGSIRAHLDSCYCRCRRLSAAVAPSHPPPACRHGPDTSLPRNFEAAPDYFRRTRRPRFPLSSFWPRTPSRSHQFAKPEENGPRRPPLDLARRQRRACAILLWMIVAGPVFLATAHPFSGRSAFRQSPRFMIFA